MIISQQIKETKQTLTAKNIIQTSGYMVVCSNNCSFSLLQNRLFIDRKTTYQILYILERLGIIGFDGSSYQVLIDDINELEKMLDILFENHQKKFHDKS
jgi:hypothetical protein